MRENIVMEKKTSSREIVASNLKALMLRNEHSEGYLHKRTSLSQSTIGRILKRESSATIDTLDAIASVYGLSSWQLLVNELDVSNPPVLKNMSAKEQAFYEKMQAVMKELQ